MDAIIRSLVRGEYPFRPQDINKTMDTMYKYTPLHLAVLFCEEQSVFNRLISEGANVHIKDRTGTSALQLAMRFGKPHLWQSMISSAESAQSQMASTVRLLDETKRENIELHERNSDAIQKLQDLTVEHTNLQESFSNLSRSLRKRTACDSYSQPASKRSNTNQDR
jgi:ankyrin repeat protein